MNKSRKENKYTSGFTVILGFLDFKALNINLVAEQALTGAIVLAAFVLVIFHVVFFIKTCSRAKLR